MAAPNTAAASLPRPLEGVDLEQLGFRGFPEHPVASVRQNFGVFLPQWRGAVLINLEHRGAVGGDKSTGDGAGLLLQIPDKFFREAFAAQDKELPARGDYAVGPVFLPTEDDLRERCEKAFEKIAVEEGSTEVRLGTVLLGPRPGE